MIMHPMQEAHAVVTALASNQEEAALSIIEDSDDQYVLAAALAAQAATYLLELSAARGVSPLEALQYMGGEYQARVDDGRLQ